MEKQSSEYCIFVFKRGNSFNGHKLNEDGTIIYTIKHRFGEDGEKIEYADTIELTVEHAYETEPNSDAYRLLSEKFENGNVLRITTTINDDGFSKTVQKVTDKEFCMNTKKSWDEIKHHWFRPQEATESIEKHIQTL